MAHKTTSLIIASSRCTLLVLKARSSVIGMTPLAFAALDENVSQFRSETLFRKCALLMPGYPIPSLESLRQSGEAVAVHSAVHCNRLRWVLNTNERERVQTDFGE